MASISQKMWHKVDLVGGCVGQGGANGALFDGVVKWRRPPEDDDALAVACKRGLPDPAAHVLCVLLLHARVLRAQLRTAQAAA